jgi:hypothetical protein
VAKSSKTSGSNHVDMTKSQVKGSHARTRHKLNLFTSPLFCRRFRQLFGSFPGHRTKIQTPGQIVVSGKTLKFADGIRFPEILVEKKS